MRGFLREEGRAPTIIRLRVENYPSLKDVDLKLHQRNMLGGSNMTGKSSLIDGFRDVIQRVCGSPSVRRIRDRNAQGQLPEGSRRVGAGMVHTSGTPCQAAPMGVAAIISAAYLWPRWKGRDLMRSTVRRWHGR